jgi:hypothetical protein
MSISIAVSFIVQMIIRSCRRNIYMPNSYKKITRSTDRKTAGRGRGLPDEASLESLNNYKILHGSSDLRSDVYIGGLVMNVIRNLWSTTCLSNP